MHALQKFLYLWGTLIVKNTIKHCDSAATLFRHFQNLQFLRNLQIKYLIILLLQFCVPCALCNNLQNFAEFRKWPKADFFFMRFENIFVEAYMYFKTLAVLCIWQKFNYTRSFTNKLNTFQHETIAYSFTWQEHSTCQVKLTAQYFPVVTHPFMIFFILGWKFNCRKQNYL